MAIDFSDFKMKLGIDWYNKENSYRCVQVDTRELAERAQRAQAAWEFLNNYFHNMAMKYFPTEYYECMDEFDMKWNDIDDFRYYIEHDVMEAESC